MYTRLMRNRLMIHDYFWKEFSYLMTLNGKIMAAGVTAKKSYEFALVIVKMGRKLSYRYNEYVLARQLIRSGTAIGALVREAEHAQSGADFLHKMNIALKEANETAYWLLLLRDSDLIELSEYRIANAYCEELIRLLASIVKTMKSRVQTVSS
jgi:four helix bundle protein